MYTIEDSIGEAQKLINSPEAQRIIRVARALKSAERALAVLGDMMAGEERPFTAIERATFVGRK